MEAETQGPPNTCREVRHPGDEASPNQKKCTEHFARGVEREGTVKHQREMQITKKNGCCRWWRAQGLASERFEADGSQPQAVRLDIRQPEHGRATLADCGRLRCVSPLSGACLRHDELPAFSMSPSTLGLDGNLYVPEPSSSISHLSLFRLNHRLPRC